MRPICMDCRFYLRQRRENGQEHTECRRLERPIPPDLVMCSAFYPGTPGTDRYNGAAYLPTFYGEKVDPRPNPPSAEKGYV